MSTLLNKFLLLVSYNIITYELYILLYRLFGISSEGCLWFRFCRFRFSASCAGSPLVLVRCALFSFCGFSSCRDQISGRGWIVPGVPSAVVSASAPVIAGGFRDNALRGVLLQKLRRRAGCFLPLSVLLVACSPVFRCQCLRCAALIGLRWCGLHRLPVFLSVRFSDWFRRSRWFLWDLRKVSGLLPGFRGFSVGFCRGCQPVRDLDRVLLVFSWEL